jgi:hypothetical protein
MWMGLLDTRGTPWIRPGGAHRLEEQEMPQFWRATSGRGIMGRRIRRAEDDAVLLLSFSQGNWTWESCEWTDRVPCRVDPAWR